MLEQHAERAATMTAGGQGSNTGDKHPGEVSGGDDDAGACSRDPGGASPSAPIYTVGHSTHPIERFVGLLQQHGIEMLVDVRSTPFSRFNPHFNRAALAHSLASAGIRYEFMGEALGARTNDPACFENGRVSYARLAATPLFQQGIARLREAAKGQRVAMMCAEREPLDCHRTILIARELEKAGESVTHILADGSLEQNSHALGRLVDQLRLPKDDLFSDPSDRIEAAYDARAAQVSWAPKARKDSGPGGGGRQPAKRVRSP
jgi:hypothetical protein